MQTLPAEAENLAYASGMLRSDRLSLPDFIGIGFMKCGTTWLYENLRAHPDVYMSEAKELRFFQSGRMRAGLGSYARNFTAARGRLRGEISPPYAWLPTERIRFIHRVMPDVRLLVMLRDPVAREWSRVRHLARQRGLDVRTAEESVIFDLIDNGHAMERGGYTGTMDRWRSVFPEEQLFIGFYEDIRMRPQALMLRVFEFLDLETDVDWEAFPLHDVIIPPAGARYADKDQGRGVVADDHQNSGTYFPARYREHLTDMFRDELLELHSRFGPAVLAWKSAQSVLPAAASDDRA